MSIQTNRGCSIISHRLVTVGIAAAKAARQGARRASCRERMVASGTGDGEQVRGCNGMSVSETDYIPVVMGTDV